jgi:hypothetical protein
MVKLSSYSKGTTLVVTNPDEIIYGLINDYLEDIKKATIIDPTGKFERDIKEYKGKYPSLEELYPENLDIIYFANPKVFDLNYKAQIVNDGGFNANNIHNKITKSIKEGSERGVLTSSNLVAYFITNRNTFYKFIMDMMNRFGYNERGLLMFLNKNKTVEFNELPELANTVINYSDGKYKQIKPRSND